MDLLVLWRDLENSRLFAESLSQRLKSIGLSWCIVNTWGVVAPIVMRAPTLHLHIETVSGFKCRSSLYRRSVAKYKPLVGKPLTVFSSNDPITIAELRNDPLGPVALRDALMQENGFLQESWMWRDNKWQLVRSRCMTAELPDLICYAVLHSARNTLRFLGCYQEFSQTSKLPEQWSSTGAPNTPILKQIIRVKYDRRRFVDIASQVAESLRQDAVTFLGQLMTWLEERETKAV